MLEVVISLKLSINENVVFLTLIVMPYPDLAKFSQAKDVRKVKHIHLITFKFVPVAAFF